MRDSGTERVGEVELMVVLRYRDNADFVGYVPILHPTHPI